MYTALGHEDWASLFPPEVDLNTILNIMSQKILTILTAPNNIDCFQNWGSLSFAKNKFPSIVPGTGTAAQKASPTFLTNAPNPAFLTMCRELQGKTRGFVCTVAWREAARRLSCHVPHVPKLQAREGGSSWETPNWLPTWKRARASSHWHGGLGKGTTAGDTACSHPPTTISRESPALADTWQRPTYSKWIWESTDRKQWTLFSAYWNRCNPQENSKCQILDRDSK